nr:histone-lysine N-methyltransferase SETMAR-like [Leptinotarsa decemlineata]
MLFAESREDVNDDAGSGRSCRSITDGTVGKVKKIVMENRQITVREVLEDIGVSDGSSCNFPVILGSEFRFKSTDFRPQNRCMSIAQELLNDVNGDPDLLDRVITGDELWVYGYDIETKFQLFQWKTPAEPRPKKSGQIITAESYCVKIDKIAKTAHQQPELVNRRDPILLHDNAFLHAPKIDKLSVELQSHPPYSPDLSPIDYHIFHHSDNFLTGRTYFNQGQAKIQA